MNNAFRDYLIAFQPQLKRKYTPMIEHKSFLLQTEPSEFHEEVLRQYYDGLAELLSMELAQNFNTDPEEIMSFLQTFDIENWLNKG